MSVSGQGATQGLCWFADHSLAVCFSRSKVRLAKFFVSLILIEMTRFKILTFTHSIDTNRGKIFLQDIQLVHYTADQYGRNKVLACARKTLKKYGIMGLHQAPCLRALLQKLPLILQEQYMYEKVYILDTCSKRK